MLVAKWVCQGYEFKNGLGDFAHCAIATNFLPQYIWTRYPLPTTRMWNLLYVFDLPAYAAFFTVLSLTAAMMKLFSMIGSKLGLGTTTKEVILIPLR